MGEVGPRSRNGDTLDRLRATAPLIVVEGTDAALRHAVDRVRAAGWAITEGWSDEARAGNVVRVATVTGPDDAARVVLAALAGDGVIVAAHADGALIDTLVDDLRRLGPVDHVLREPDAPIRLPPESGAILGLLAEGHSLGEAASILGLARRTADRRLAQARRVLGVERTTEAIVQAARRGLLRPPQSD